MNFDSSNAVGKRLRGVWPEVKITDLLEAGLASDERARAAFAHWQSVQELDLARWSEIRLLAATAKRLLQVAPEYPHHGRIQGFRRYIFTHSHRMLHATRPMLQALHDVGIEFMLLKGAVRLAVNPALAADRYMSDVDVLVRIEDWGRTCAVAREQHWELPPKNRTSRAPDLESTYPYVHSLDFTSAGGERLGHLDLHHHARHMCRNDGDDDPLWTHSQPIEFLGVPARIPAPTDQLLVSLTHASSFAGRATVAAGDWALDMALTLAGGGIDWERLVRDAIALRTQAYVASALLFGRERLELAIPEDAIAELARATNSNLLAELDYSHRGHPGDMSSTERALKARDVAAARAKAAFAREGRKPVARDRLELPTPALPARIEPGSEFDLPVPEPLRPSDEIALDVSFNTVPGAGRTLLGIDSPGPVLAIWRRGDEGAQAPSRHGEMSVTLAPELFIMGRAHSVSVRVRGEKAITDVRARWRTPSLGSRLARRLGRARRRLARLLRPRAG